MSYVTIDSIVLTRISKVKDILEELVPKVELGSVEDTEVSKALEELQIVEELLKVSFALAEAESSNNFFKEVAERGTIVI